MSTLTLIFLLGMAVARLTRAWRDDVIMEMPRHHVGNFLSTEDDDLRYWAIFKDWLDEMLGCPWCLSGWLSGAAVIFVDSATSRSVDLPFLAWLASWWVACVGYWLAELIADRDALAYWERKNKGIG